MCGCIGPCGAEGQSAKFVTRVGRKSEPNAQVCTKPSWPGTIFVSFPTPHMHRPIKFDRAPKSTRFMSEPTFPLSEGEHLPVCLALPEKKTRAQQPTFSTSNGFSVMVLSPALSATMVSTHRFGRNTLRTLLMIDLRTCRGKSEIQRAQMLLFTETDETNQKSYRITR